MKPDWKQVLIAFIVVVTLGALFVLRVIPHASFHHHTMRQLNSKLHLTADQQEKINDISEDARKKIGTLRNQVHPKFEDIRTSSRTEIRKLLAPDQQVKFDEMTAKMDARLARHRVEWRKNSDNAGF